MHGSICFVAQKWVTGLAIGGDLDKFFMAI